MTFRDMMEYITIEGTIAVKVWNDETEKYVAMKYFTGPNIGEYMDMNILCMYPINGAICFEVEDD